MALTIGSVGNRAEQRRNLLIHSVGVILGSMVLGLTLVLAGAALHGLLQEPRHVLELGAAVVLIGWAASVLTGIGLPFPNSHWQVPKDWRHTLPFGFTVGAYGFLLGLGVLTNVVVPVLWALIAASLVLANTPAVMTIWLVYGITRAAITARETLKVGSSDDPGTQQARPSHLGFVKGTASILLLLLAGGLVF